MQKGIEEILDRLIAEINKGKSVEDCLREYREYAAELRPLLELFEQIRGLPMPEPDSRRVASTQRKARTLIEEKRKVKSFSIRDIFVLRPALVRITAVVLLVLLATVTTVMLSADSLPGDALYSVKLLAEDVQYFLTFDAEGKARLHLMFADRRTNEFACLVQPGVPIDRDLLADMLSETGLAIDHIELLSEEDAAQLIAHAEACNHAQLSLLEATMEQVCEDDRVTVREAIDTCMEQHECIECLQNGNGMDETDCPCEGP